jgi:integrase
MLKKRSVGRPRKWESLLKRYLAELEEIGLSPEHRNGIRRTVTKAFDFFTVKDPILVKEDEIRAWVNQWNVEKTRRFYRSNLNGYLKYCENYVIEGMRWPRYHDVRLNVRWLSQDQVNAIMEVEMSPREEIIIRLALDMALRRAEIRRAMIQDVDPAGYLTVRGKGNKLRTVPFSPEFFHTYQRYLQEREEILTHTRQDPGYLLLVIYRGKVKGVSNTFLDDTCTRISERTRNVLHDPQFKFSFHDLRRTWARTAWEIGIPIETIALILGHSDIRTTQKYIGANVNHARDAMKQIHSFRSQQVMTARRIRK